MELDLLCILQPGEIVLVGFQKNPDRGEVGEGVYRLAGLDVIAFTLVQLQDHAVLRGIEGDMVGGLVTLLHRIDLFRADPEKAQLLPFRLVEGLASGGRILREVLSGLAQSDLSDVEIGRVDFRDVVALAHGGPGVVDEEPVQAPGHAGGGGKDASFVGSDPTEEFQPGHRRLSANRGDPHVQAGDRVRSELDLPQSAGAFGGDGNQVHLADGAESRPRLTHAGMHRAGPNRAGVGLR